MIRSKWPAIGRVVASGSPETRRKGLDYQVEWSSPEAPQARRKGLDD